MVLLDRIELSTSPLPRECSTTELQQRRCEAGGLCHSGPGPASPVGPNAAKISAGVAEVAAAAESLRGRREKQPFPVTVGSCITSISKDLPVPVRLNQSGDDRASSPYRPRP